MNNSFNGRKKQVSNEMREMIVDRVVNNGESVTLVAEHLRIKRTTVAMIVINHTNTGVATKSMNRGKPPKKITVEVGEYIERLIETDPSITLKQIKERCLADKEVDVSVAAIHNHLVAIKITLKRLGIILDRVNDPERIALRKAYASDFLANASVDDRKNIFIDESGFNLHLRRNYGRSPSGSRANTNVPTVRGINTTLLAAINSSGIVHFKVFPGACTSDIFINFMNELDEIVVQRLEILDACYYMDNARVHTSHNTRAALEQLNGSAKYLSPYSYMLNPIEFSFSKIKSIARSLLVGRDLDLAEVISNSVSRVEDTDCEGWFRLIRRNCFLATIEHQFN